MQSQSGASGAELMRLYQVRISNTLYSRISNSTLYREQTSLPYFGVKLSCVCLMFAYRKRIAYSYPKVT